MNSASIYLKQILPTVLICGLLGGGLLISTTLISTRGWWLILIYGLVMYATMTVVKFNRKIEITYFKIFVIGVLTFMIMTFVLYLYITIFVNPNNGITFLGHLWRFFMMLGIALTSSATLGLFFTNRNQNAAQTP